MRCSVVVCTRNGELFLREQLASFLRQERLPDEIIICDDASSDATPSIIDEFVAQAIGLGIECQVHQHLPPLGVTGNFEFACRRASGEIIFLSDQDDSWREDKITKILSALGDPGVVLVNSDASLIDGDGHPLGENLFGRLRVTAREYRALGKGDLEKVGAYRNLFTGATMAFRRTLLESALPFPDKVHHDDWLSQLAWLTGGTTRTIFEPLIDYRLHSANTIGLGAASAAGENEPAPGRRAHFLLEQKRRLEPVVERGTALAGQGKVLNARAVFRRKQLELACLRSSYSRNPLRRCHQVFKALVDGRYATLITPWRSVFGDLFRPAGS